MYVKLFIVNCHIPSINFQNKPLSSRRKCFIFKIKTIMIFINPIILTHSFSNFLRIKNHNFCQFPHIYFIKVLEHGPYPVSNQFPYNDSMKHTIRYPLITSSIGG